MQTQMLRQTEATEKKSVPKMADFESLITAVSTDSQSLLKKMVQARSLGSPQSHAYSETP